jgi:hypothetical protein
MLRTQVPVLSLLGVSTLAVVAVILEPWHGQVERRGEGLEESDLLRALDSRLESLEVKVAALANRIEYLESNRLPTREPVVPDPAGRLGQTEASLVGLADRVSRLEQLERTRTRRVAEREDDRASRMQSQSPQDRVEATQRIIRDRGTSLSDKAQAWLDLAQQEVYPWTDDIIAEMMSIGLNSEDDRAREVVWIGAESQYRNDLLVQPLISALSDREADVREEAADALSQYLDKPGVQRALLWTSNNDESEEVRNEAARALRGEE